MSHIVLRSLYSYSLLVSITWLWNRDHGNPFFFGDKDKSFERLITLPKAAHRARWFCFLMHIIIQVSFYRKSQRGKNVAIRIIKEGFRREMGPKLGFKIWWDWSKQKVQYRSACLAHTVFVFFFFGWGFCFNVLPHLWKLRDLHRKSGSLPSRNVEHMSTFATMWHGIHSLGPSSECAL